MNRQNIKCKVIISKGGNVLWIPRLMGVFGSLGRLIYYSVFFFNIPYVNEPQQLMFYVNLN